MPDFSGSVWPLIALPSVFYDVSVRREAFEPMMESGELVVRYRARRTYSRRTTEATRESPFLPLHVTQRDGTLSICTTQMSLQQFELCLSACPNLPLSPG